MGYQLALFALDWGVLRTGLGGGYPDLARHVEALPPLLGERPRAEQAPPIRDLAGGPTGRALAAGQAVEADDRLALAFSAVVRTMGVPVAELHHNSAAGSRFRHRFILSTVARLVGGVDTLPLIDRPLIGLSHLGYPGWGGLTLAEMLGPFAPLLAPPPELPDTDEDDWLHSLRDGMAEAAARRTDLVTLYH